ncbi:hypothetical protein DPMN_063076 [Dreissena polymorpha]|uniref:Uncharacterized protein n=1 Tax=Dreissena polymorpha TaxID=45954 RepID=A0A9D4HIQ9_DREPO|nr:hypothetical protein DPMN_063076 [Dreissena polymorpha]
MEERQRLQQRRYFARKSGRTRSGPRSWPSPWSSPYLKRATSGCARITALSASTATPTK